jgi:hypothetical protein
MEHFFIHKPIEDYRFPMQLSDWFESEIVFQKREQIAKVMQDKMSEQGKVVELPNIILYKELDVENGNFDMNVIDKDGLNNNNNGEDLNNNNGNGDENDQNNNNNEEAFNNNNDFYEADHNVPQPVEIVPTCTNESIPMEVDESVDKNQMVEETEETSKEARDDEILDDCLTTPDIVDDCVCISSESEPE